MYQAHQWGRTFADKHKRPSSLLLRSIIIYLLREMAHMREHSQAQTLMGHFIAKSALLLGSKLLAGIYAHCNSRL